MLDRNDAVSSAYAAAAGYLARLASEKAILQLLEFAQKLYFEHEGASLSYWGAVPELTVDILQMSDIA